MDSVVSFRRSLAQRIAVALAVTVVLAAPLLPGCGAGTSGSTEPSGGTCAGGTGNPEPFLACIHRPLDGCPTRELARPSIRASLDSCSCLVSVQSDWKIDPKRAAFCCYDTIVDSTCFTAPPPSR
ncbi:hypothetical protein [Polyangium aurulentum]|uniref:hypothetical protein n=1 Tax=Polyangium aurulentum TaxID=2567896 RepID=UPI0010AEABCC|nr:hypothetical protein [Polyangium aurulentum]UQA55991.1 hypothetical protein E8A73_032335 [Polyangium aurulentum]